MKSYNLGYNYLKHLKDNSLEDKEKRVYHYSCEDYASIGRTIAYVVKHLKKLDLKDCSAILITNIENTVFKRDPVEVLDRYRRIYSAGNQTKGPFTPRTVPGLFKKLLRNNLKYKNEDKALFKRICVLTTAEYDSMFPVKSKNFTSLAKLDSTYHMRQNYFGLKIKLKQLITKL